MNIGFRVDSSTSMGSGHVMRCLVLAQQLRSLGAKIFFISRKLPGNLINKQRKKFKNIIILPKPKKYKKKKIEFR